VRAVFDAKTTTQRERKQPLRAVIDEVIVTVHRDVGRADLRIIWQGAATLELSMTLNKTGHHRRVTDEDTVDLVRRLATHYSDTAIAIILAKRGRRTATGLGWTKTHVKALRVARGIPAYQPPEPVGGVDDDADVVTINEAERRLGVSRVTLYRWLRDGFIVGEQPTPNAPGASASTSNYSTKSGLRCRKAGSPSTKPHKPSEWPARPCCTRSNAANCRPSTSTGDDEKACGYR
jgi:hypothetical protein